MINVINVLSRKFSRRILCDVLEINRSTTYDRRKRAKKPKNKKIAKLEGAIIKIALTNKAYGYKRVAAEAKRKNITLERGEYITQ